MAAPAPVAVKKKSLPEHTKVAYHNLTVAGTKYAVMTSGFQGAYQWYFADFIYRLFNTRTDYYHLTQQPGYFVPEVACFVLQKHIAVAIPYKHIKVLQQLTPEFFKAFKKYYLRVMLNGRGSIMAQLLTGTTTSKTDIRKMLQKLSCKQVIELLHHAL